MSKEDKPSNGLVESHRPLFLLVSYFLFAGVYYLLCQLSFILGWGGVLFTPPWEFPGIFGFVSGYALVWLTWFIGLIPLLIVTAVNMWFIAKLLYTPYLRPLELFRTILYSVLIALPFITIAGNLFFFGPTVFFFWIPFVLPYPWQSLATLLSVGFLIFPLVLAYLLLQASTVTQQSKNFSMQVIKNPLFWIAILVVFLVFWIALLELGQTLFRVINDTTVVLLFYTLPVTSIYVALILPLFPLVVIGGGIFRFSSFS